MPESQRFGFLETPEGSAGTPPERRLIDLDVPAMIDVDRIAERIAALSEQERRGSPRVEEAAIQNSIIRGMDQGTIGDPKKFRLTLIEAAQRHGERQMTKEIDRILAGVDGVLGVIRAQRDGYVRTRAERPTLRQFIGLNDVLDARHAIDCVDIRYEPGPPLHVTDVAFIQAKAGAITEEERVEIHAMHRVYYTEHLATLPDVEERELVAHAVTEVGLELERDMALADNVALELLTAQEADAKAIDVVAARTGRSITWLSCFLLTNRAQIILHSTNDKLATDAEERAALRVAAARLVAAAHARDLPLTALRALFPTWTLDPRFVAASMFTSIVDAGGARTIQYLNRPGEAPRTLTVHAA